jgi:cysteine-rich repeat protein
VRGGRIANSPGFLGGGASCLTLSALVALALFGCSTPTPSGDGGLDAAGPDLTACASNRDCGGGEVCRGGFCRTSCASDTECEAPLSVCDADLEYCVECSADADCGSDEACVDNACAFYCREDAACASDEYCVTATGVCAERECEVTADCEGGFRCDGFVCMPIDDLVCEPDEQVCSGGGTTVLRCNADGTMETMETCGSGSVCVQDGAMADCRPVVCTAGERGCTSDFVAYACDATGTERTETPCVSGQYCAAGACMAQACTPGSARCTAGGGREVCDARGAGYAAMPCGPTQSCSGGACVDRVCVPGEARCVAGSLTAREVCAPDGLAWTAMPCAGTESCSAGLCRTRLCVPGAPECVGTTGSRTCNADGLGYSATVSCGASSSCVAGTGMCSGWLCSPGTSTCLSSSVRRACNADGLGFTETTCGAGTTCSAGVCAPWVCTPGSYSCADVNTRRLCNADGLGYTTASCTGPDPDGYSCTGAGTCSPRECVPGSASSVCASTTARQVCNTDGLGFTASACASGQSCLTGTCAVRCGDGIRGGTETCDDGNTVSGDGCSSTCASEFCSAMSTPSRGGYAQVADAVPLRLASTSFTVEMWAYATDFSASCNNALIAKRGSGFADGWFLSVIGPGCGTTGRLAWAQSAGGDPNVQAASVLAPTGRWFHVAYTYDRAASRGTIWLDGVSVGTGTMPPPVGTTTAPLRIGQDPGGGMYGWRGYLDDVRISNTARYSSTFTPATSLTADASTIGLWRFEEGSGATAADSSSSGYTASLVSGATWTTVPGCTR